jgi:hemerythrin
MKIGGIYLIQWKDEFKLGIEQIDEQHERLFQIANEIYDLIKNEFIADKYDSILKLINELKDYTVFHFSSEEEYMQSIGYRKYLSHKVEHTDFIEKINNVNLEQVDLNHEQYLVDMLNFVVNWISNHILETDKAYTLQSI